MPAEIRSDPALLVAIDREPAALETRANPQSVKSDQSCPQVVPANPVDDDLTVGDGRQPDETADFDVIRADLVAGALEGRPPRIT